MAPARVSRWLEPVGPRDVSPPPALPALIRLGDTAFAVTVPDSETGATFRSAPALPRPPNIIVILADDLGLGDLVSMAAPDQDATWPLAAAEVSGAPTFTASPMSAPVEGGPC